MSSKILTILLLAGVLAVGIFIAINSSQPYIYEPGYAGSYTYNLLLNSGLGMMLGATGLGIVAGAVVGFIKGKAKRSKTPLGAGALFDDWGMSFSAMAGAILIVTGIMLGGTWSSRIVVSQTSIASTINMHFIGIVILLFGSFYTISRMLTANDYTILISLRDSLNFKEKGLYLPSYRFGVWTFIAGFSALAIKGFFLVVVHLFNWPTRIIVVVSGIHDVLALIALVLAVISIGFLVLETTPVPRQLPKTTKSTV